MKTLFERVFNGSDEMFAKAEEEVNKIVAEVGRDAALTMPSTAYFLACIYAYIGKKVTNVGELAGQTVHHIHFHVLSGKQLGSFN